VRDDNGCLIWTGGLNRAGYGVICVAGRYYRVHRLMYELVNGALPQRLHVYHPICNRKECCEPKHLKVGTHREVMLHASARGTLLSGKRASIVVRAGLMRKGMPVRLPSPMLVGLR
jgi:hypothetical protein